MYINMLLLLKFTQIISIQHVMAWL